MRGVSLGTHIILLSLVALVGLSSFGFSWWLLVPICAICVGVGILDSAIMNLEKQAKIMQGQISYLAALLLNQNKEKKK